MKMYPVPARRCDIYINVFEKHMTEIQERVARLQRLESYYNVVSSVVNEWKEPNEVKVEMSEYGSVSISIQLTRNDKLAIADKLIEDIGANLLKKGLHKDGIPSKGETTRGWGNYTKLPNGKQEYISTTVYLKIPEEGCADYYWHKEEYTIKDYRNVLTKRGGITPKGSSYE